MVYFVLVKTVGLSPSLSQPNLLSSLMPPEPNHCHTKLGYLVLEHFQQSPNAFP